jgi:integrase
LGPRFIRIQGLRLPVDLGEKEAVAFLVKLAAEDIGLRLMEASTLRVKDVDFNRGEIRVTRGKGDKDQVTVLPRAARTTLVSHVPGRCPRLGRSQACHLPPSQTPIRSEP